MSRALQERGVPTILLDPKPRIQSCEQQGNIRVIAKALVGDGSDLLTPPNDDDDNDDTAVLIRQCSFIAGMHPDQATEAIVDLSQRLGVPFALLPCCVMPSLFPLRRQNKGQGEPIRSYSAFCQYLLDKAPAKGEGQYQPRQQQKYHVGHLPFVGRNKIIYSVFASD